MSQSSDIFLLLSSPCLSMQLAPYKVSVRNCKWKMSSVMLSLKHLQCSGNPVSWHTLYLYIYIHFMAINLWTSDHHTYMSLLVVGHPIPSLWVLIQSCPPFAAITTSTTLCVHGISVCLAEELKKKRILRASIGVALHK